MRYALAAFAAAIATAAPALAQDASESIEAQVTTMDGQSAGTVTFEQVEHGVVTARLENLPEGPHGFHIHETGACEPDFRAAGGHHNPPNAGHGFDTPGGYHVGDLPNIYVSADGTATADFFAPQITLAEDEDDEYPNTLRDADGSAIMIHAEIDDYQAEPPDSTRSRMACGVIVPNGDGG